MTIPSLWVALLLVTFLIAPAFAFAPGINARAAKTAKHNSRKAVRMSSQTVQFGSLACGKCTTTAVKMECVDPNAVMDQPRRVRTAISERGRKKGAGACCTCCPADCYCCEGGCSCC